MEDDTRDQNIPEASSATSKNHSSSGSSRPQVANASAFINKRSRGLGVVTPNACTECRKKRAKVGVGPHNSTFATFLGLQLPVRIAV